MLGYPHVMLGVLQHSVGKKFNPVWKVVDHLAQVTLPLSLLDCGPAGLLVTARLFEAGDDHHPCATRNRGRDSAPKRL